ncbi:MAG: YceD family protein [Burkholderiaceae bacterium]
MKKEFVADHLDVKAFAQAGDEWVGQDVLQKYERMMQETQGLGGDLAVHWSALGELRPVLGGPDQVWLHLQVQATLPLVCQRCLGRVDSPVSVERSFRFVADEDAAAAQDDESEEEVLALSRDFNLSELIEDELLMELPLVPRHEQCPTEVKLAAVDQEFEAASAARPNPFAVLSRLQRDKSS